MPEPQDALPPEPWGAGCVFGGWIPLVDGEVKPFAYVDEIHPCRDAVVMFLLAAPNTTRRLAALEQAARDGIALIEGEFGELGPPAIQAVKERLRVALGARK
jgi:hypothetical protein